VIIHIITCINIDAIFLNNWIVLCLNPNYFKIIFFFEIFYNMPLIIFEIQVIIYVILYEICCMTLI